MGAIKHYNKIIVNKNISDCFSSIKSIFKKLIYPIQYENEEKYFIVAKIEQIWLAPSGELIIIDLKYIEDDMTEIVILSKDLVDTGMNFNRNVKNVNRMSEIFNKEFNQQI